MYGGMCGCTWSDTYCLESLFFGLPLLLLLVSHLLPLLKVDQPLHLLVKVLADVLFLFRGHKSIHFTCCPVAQVRSAHGCSLSLTLAMLHAYAIAVRVITLICMLAKWPVSPERLWLCTVVNAWNWAHWSVWQLNSCQQTAVVFLWV